MRIATFCTLALRALARFKGAQKGNVAITFALSALPIIGFVGASVDYSRANSIKSAMQAALDSTALMLSRDAATLSSADLQTKATNYFNAMFTRPETNNAQVTATYSAAGGSKVAVAGSVDMPTQFMSIIGYNNITVTGTSTAAWGSTRLRVSLVLDTTGSMSSDGKMAALKTATKSLLTQLQNAAGTDGDVYVSIVPFSRDVAIDPSNYNASWDNWIDWTDWLAPPPNSMPDMSVGPGSSCPYTKSNGFSCSPTPTSTSTTKTIPSSGTYSGYICPSVDSSSDSYYNGCYNSTTYTSTGSSATCTGHSNCSCSGNGSNKTCKTNSGYYEHAWVPNAKSTWNGCITDRGTTTAPSAANYDQNVTAPVPSTAASKYPAEQYSMCTQPMIGLNYNWSSMRSFVDTLTPNGNTNQPVGLVWGWQSLVGGGPLTMPPKDANYKYNEIIILLTDGLNTQNRWYTNQTSVDKRMYDASKSGAGTCTNIKNSGITIYTVQVNTGGDPTSTLLQNCAGSPDKMVDPSKFYLLTTASAIATAFNQIGTNLTQLRVAK